MSARPGAAPAAPELPPAEPASDPLSDVLRTVRLTGALFFQVRACSPWMAHVPEGARVAPILLPRAQNIVSYHIVAQGECYATLAGSAPQKLSAGDVVLLPGNTPYTLSSSPLKRPAVELERTLANFQDLAIRKPAFNTLGSGTSQDCQLVCGYLGCDVRPFNPVLAALPPMVRVRVAAEGEDRLGPLIEFALAESRAQRSGGQVVLLRLSELMFVEVVRRYLSGLSTEQSGWLAGLRDPVVGRALALLHAGPGRAWTLEALAAEVNASRTTLAERFAHFVGQPPMAYLAHWRMQVAARMLAEGTAKVAAIAQAVGYESEPAFSRAFKRIVGESPAIWRRGAV